MVSDLTKTSMTLLVGPVKQLWLLSVFADWLRVLFSAKEKMGRGDGRSPQERFDD
jgi:hypothetical protein